MKLEKALRILAKRNSNKTILFTIDNNNISLSSQDIMYIEVINHDLYIYTATNKYHIRSSMKKAMNELKGLTFSRCHASYLVNLSYVSYTTKSEIVLTNGNTLPITRSKRTEFLNDLSKYLSGGGITSHVLLHYQLHQLYFSV